MNLAIDLGFAQAAGDELGILRAEVEDDDGFFFYQKSKYLIIFE